MRLKCDLHVHSVLSGCASRDNGVLNIINMARVCGTEVLAVADHNCGANAEAALAAAKKHDILLIPALEATTAEDIHVLCYFKEIGRLRAFSKLLWDNMPKYPLDERFYFPQVVENAAGKEAGRIDYLLNTATDFGIYDLAEAVREFGGVCVPAHVNRNACGIVNVLGYIPCDLEFRTVEITKDCNAALRAELEKDFLLLTSSDAHSLGQMAAHKGFLELEEKSAEGLFEVLLKGNKKGKYINGF